MNKLTTQRPTVLEAERFDAAVLRELLGGRAAAVRVPGLVTEEEGRRVAAGLARLAEFGGTDHAQQIGRLGLSFQQTTGQPLLRERYFREASAWEEALREVANPGLSPTETMMALLRENWRAGARRECVAGRPMFVGAVRLFGNSAGALPHQDILARDMELETPLRLQLAATLYLSPSVAGGELELWLRKPTGAEFEAIRLPGTWDADRERLGEPDFVLAPRAGELVVYDAGYLHAARPTRGGLRATVSLFVGYRGPDEPLTFWS